MTSGVPAAAKLVSYHQS